MLNRLRIFSGWMLQGFGVVYERHLNTNVLVTDLHVILISIDYIARRLRSLATIG